jgi:hypothetical protein
LQAEDKAAYIGQSRDGRNALATLSRLAKEYFPCPTKFARSIIASSDMRRTITKLLVFVVLLLVLDRLVYAGAVFLRDHGAHPVEIDLIYDDAAGIPPSCSSAIPARSTISTCMRSKI